MSKARWFDEMVVKGHRPVGALGVEVEEAFAHCQKAFLRSQLWRPETWRPEAVAPFAEKIRETQWRDASLEQVEAYYGPDYANRLYRGQAQRLAAVRAVRSRAPERECGLL